MKKQEKVFAVADLQQRLKEAKAIVLVDFQGLKVSQINELRNLIKSVGGSLMVVKNNLLVKALEGENLPAPKIEGPTALILANEDEIAPLKTAFSFAQNFGLPTFKLGIWEDRILTREELEELGRLPSKEFLLGKLISILALSGIHLIKILSANQQKLIFILKGQIKGGEN